MTDTQIKPPTSATLAKYGMNEDDWWEILRRQGGVCPIMGTVPSTGRFVIDHEHVKGWKTMPPEERKLYVRGLVSWYANHAYLARGINVERAQRVVNYLSSYRARLARALAELHQ